MTALYADLNAYSVALITTLVLVFQIILRNFLVQSNFNGSNTFGTIKISLRQGWIDPRTVDESARSGSTIRISLIFYNMKVSCVFSLESPQ